MSGPDISGCGPAPAAAPVSVSSAIVQSSLAQVRSRGWWVFAGGVFLGGLCLYFLWALPVVWPLRAVVVSFREIGHAAALLGSGGELSLKLSAARGGVVVGSGGFAFVVAHGGILGPMCAGALLLLLARSAAGARVAMRSLAVVIGVATLWMVRPLASMAFVYPMGIVAAIVAGAHLLKDPLMPAAAVGVRVIAALLIFAVLWDNDYSEKGAQGSSLVGAVHQPGLGKQLAKQSDCSRLEALTWISAKIWAFGYMAAGVCLVAILHPSPSSQRGADAAGGDFQLPEFPV